MIKLTTDYIIISGLDGVGKTTIIKSLQNELDSRGFSTQYIWLRYNHYLVKPVHGFCRLVGLSRKRVNADGKIVWRHEFYRSKLFCKLYIFLTYLDTLFSRVKVWFFTTIITPDILICDRWVYDVLIDLAVDTRTPELLESNWFKLFSLIIPLRAKQYIIKRDYENILIARPEYLNDHDFEHRKLLYEKLEQKEKPIAVENNSSVSRVVKKIMNDFLD